MYLAERYVYAYVCVVHLLLHDFPVPSRDIGSIRWRGRFKVAAKERESCIDHEDNLANAIDQSYGIEKVGIPATNIHPQVPKDRCKEGRVQEQVHDQEAVAHV